MEKIRNIIFDLGAVLVDLDEQRCVEAFRSLGMPLIADYVSDHRVEDMFMAAETGRVTQEEFCQEVRRVAGLDTGDEQIVAAWNTLLTQISDRKKERLLQLRGHYRLFLLSNTNYMHWRLCADHLFRYGEYGVEDYFERVFLSYEMHLVKPDPEIFLAVLRETGIRPEETLFVDDNPANCQAAGRLGIHTLLNEEPEQWLEELSAECQMRNTRLQR